MAILSKKQIEELMSTEQHEKRLIITPILDPEKQFSTSTIDLRLGSKFKVDLKTRMPFIDPLENSRPISTFFDETYRDFGEKFLVYPGQLVIGSTFEYVKIPNNVFGVLTTRSSWNRLGISISTIVQPGYAGVLTLDIVNQSSNPIALYPGLRLTQLVLFSIDELSERELGYLTSPISKYKATSEPILSNIDADKDLQTLKEKFPF